MNKKISVLLVVLTSSLGVCFAQTVSGTDFVLRGNNGEITARLTTGGEGTPGLFFYDANKKVRISIGLYGDGVPTVVLNDDQEKAAAIMRLVNNEGEPVVVLKEHGQDKLIIDKNGFRDKQNDSQSLSVKTMALVLVIGALGGYIGGYFSRRKLMQITPPVIS